MRDLSRWPLAICSLMFSGSLMWISSLEAAFKKINKKSKYFLRANLGQFTKKKGGAHAPTPPQCKLQIYTLHSGKY